MGSGLTLLKKQDNNFNKSAGNNFFLTMATSINFINAIAKKCKDHTCSQTQFKIFNVRTALLNSQEWLSRG
jgi:hypothetical protein